MKSHKEVSYILLCYKPYSTGCVCDLCYCVIMVWAAYFTTIESHLFSALCVLCSPGSLSMSHRHTSGFSKEAFGTLYPTGLHEDSCCMPEDWAGLCSSESGHLSNSVAFQGNVCRLIWVTLCVCICCRWSVEQWQSKGSVDYPKPTAVIFSCWS